jgi:hypothetical protein
MEAFETFEHAGLVCELHEDPDAMGPGEWDTLGTLYFFEGRNALQGSEVAPGDVFEAWDRDREGLTVRYLASQGVVAVLGRFDDYGSGGARLEDVGDTGDNRANCYIACTLERARVEGPVDGDVRRVLVAELGNWNAWVAGEVCGFVVRDPRTGEVLDSCWGFYPDHEVGDGLEDLRAEARSAAEGEREKRLERARLTLLGWGMAHGLREETIAA